MKAKKIEVDSSAAYRLLHPRQVVLVSCVDKDGRANIITLAWSMPASINPPLIVIGIAPKRYSHQLIEETKEFVVNIPTMGIVKGALLCGRRTGRTCNKFEEAKLTASPAKKVQAPIIQECVAHLECKLRQQITTGDHTLFVGEVVASYANEEVFNGKINLEKAKPIYHLGGDDFVTTTAEIVTPHL